MTHKANVLDPKIEGKQKLWNCIWMQLDHRLRRKKTSRSWSEGRIGGWRIFFHVLPCSLRENIGTYDGADLMSTLKHTRKSPNGGSDDNEECSQITATTSLGSPITQRRRSETLSNIRQFAALSSKTVRDRVAQVNNQGSQNSERQSRKHSFLSGKDIQLNNSRRYSSFNADKIYQSLLEKRQHAPSFPNQVGISSDRSLSVLEVEQPSGNRKVTCLSGVNPKLAVRGYIRLAQFVDEKYWDPRLLGWITPTLINADGEEEQGSSSSEDSSDDEQVDDDGDNKITSTDRRLPSFSSSSPLSPPPPLPLPVSSSSPPPLLPPSAAAVASSSSSLAPSSSSPPPPRTSLVDIGMPRGTMELLDVILRLNTEELRSNRNTNSSSTRR